MSFRRATGRAAGRAPGNYLNSDRAPLRIVGNLATKINNVYDSAKDGVISMKDRVISMKDKASSAVTGTIEYVGKAFERSEPVKTVAKVQEPDVSPQIEELYNELKTNYSEPKIELKGGQQDGGTYTNILAYDSPDILRKLQRNKNLVKIFKHNDQEDVLVDNMKLNILKLNLLSLRTKDSGMSAIFDKKIIFKFIDAKGIFDFQNGATLYDNMEHHSSPEKWNYHVKKYNCAILRCDAESLSWSDIARGISEQKIAIYVKDSPQEVSETLGGKRKTRRNKKMRSKKSRKNIKKRVNKKY